MSLPVTVPFTFGNATTTQSLSSLDTNFTTITNSVNGLTNGASQINVAAITATGTANAATFLRGDGAWATLTGGGTDASYANLTVTQNLIPASSFLRNRIINGAMQISQRTAVNTNVAVGTGTSGTFGPDRFYGYTATAGLWNTLQVTTGVYDFPYANRLQRIAGQTLTSPIYWRQIIEYVNCVDLSGQTVTLSFYATAGANYSGGASNVNILTGTAGDQGATSLNTGAWTSLASPLSSTFTPTASRTQFTFTATLAAVAELAVSITYTGSGTAGASDYIDITGVQLEVGTLATPFERQMYSTQLAMCQRYYQQYASANGLIVRGLPQTGTSGSVYFWIPSAVVMRAAPTMSVGAASYSNMNTASWVNIGKDGAEIAGVVTGINSYMYIPWTASAEL